MSRIPADTLNAVRDRVDIVDLIGRHVGLKKAGRTWKGLCPFHSEKTPSFNVNRAKQIFHCFGCGVGGDAFKFLELQEGLNFLEAVKQLASKAGISLPCARSGRTGGRTACRAGGCGWTAACITTAARRPATPSNIARNPKVSLHLESGEQALIVEGVAAAAGRPTPELGGRLARAYAAKYAALGYSPAA